MDRYQALLIMSWIINTSNPRQHGKGLIANHSNEWRYRIGDYRIIADINDDKIIILIFTIKHRKNSQYSR